MGFNILKAIVNPFTVLPGRAGRIGSVLSGNIIPGMMSGSSGRSGPMASKEALDYFRSQSAQDQQNIMAGFGGRPNIQGWYDNAVSAGTVPGGTASGWGGGSGGGGVHNLLSPFFSRDPLNEMMAGVQGSPRLGGPSPMPSAPPPPPPPAPMDLNAEYERIKAAQGAGAAREWLKSQQG